MEYIELKILLQGPVDFQNSVGMNVEQFLDLFKRYLGATIVKDRGQYLRQKTGLPIGTKIAPFASELFLEFVDLSIYSQLQEDIEQGRITICRY